MRKNYVVILSVHTMDYLTTMRSTAAGGHRALAVSVVVCYGVIAGLSVMRHGEKNRCHHLNLRAVSLLRDAARCSIRADKVSGECDDRYADAARARIYVAAVERLMSASDVSRLTGISLDELRDYSDNQLLEARSRLGAAQTPLLDKVPLPKNLQWGKKKQLRKK